MRIWDGNLHDKTNFESRNFLQINSCGIESPAQGYTVVRKNGRKDWLLILICDGVCEAVRNGEVYRMHPGDVMIFAPHEPQQYGYLDKCTAMWLHFSGTAIAELIGSCNLTAGYNALNRNRQVVEAFLDMIRRFHTPGRESFAKASLLELFYSLANSAKAAAEDIRNSGILSIITYINTNYSKNLTLENLAKISGYSKSRFSHLFSESTGTTPVKYQNDIRLRIACEMLSSKNMAISDIAYSCGFSDALYFSRIFAKKYGMSPREYRSRLISHTT